MKEHKNPDKLLKLLEPPKLGKVYTDGNYAYYECFSPVFLTVTKIAILTATPPISGR
jgi:hypothetical protein